MTKRVAYRFGGTIIALLDDDDDPQEKRILDAVAVEFHTGDYSRDMEPIALATLPSWVNDESVTLNLSRDLDLSDDEDEEDDDEDEDEEEA